MEELTDRQEEILDTIKKYIAKNGYPPTVREIGAILNLSSPATTHFHLNRLEKKGYKNEKTCKIFWHNCVHTYRCQCILSREEVNRLCVIPGL